MVKVELQQAVVPWGMGERVQTRLSSKCSELSDLLVRLQAEGR